MHNILLFITIVLMILAIKSHTISKAHIKEKMDKSWFERLFSGNRPAVENLTEKGLKHRRKSNLFAIGGSIALLLYIVARVKTG